MIIEKPRVEQASRLRTFGMVLLPDSFVMNVRSEDIAAELACDCTLIQPDNNR